MSETIRRFWSTARRSAMLALAFAFMSALTVDAYGIDLTVGYERPAAQSKSDPGADTGESEDSKALPESETDPEVDPNPSGTIFEVEPLILSLMEYLDGLMKFFQVELSD